VFDIGFSELLIIGLIALIVIGPKRLPKVARTVGHFAGRLQRYVADVKADINREVELEELRKMRDEVQKSASSFENSVQSELSRTEAELNSAVEAAAGGESPPKESAPALPVEPIQSPASESGPSPDASALSRKAS